MQTALNHCHPEHPAAASRLRGCEGPLSKSRGQTTGDRLFPPVSNLFLNYLTDERKLKEVYHRFCMLAGDDLSYEGFRLQITEGRFRLDDLPRLCEAMALCSIDPAVPMAALEALCIPRDPDLNGKLSNELLAMTAEMGQIAETIRTHGDALDHYSNPDIRHVLTIAGRLQAALRRLNQECLEQYGV